MLQLLTSLALLGALATPAGTSKTCPVCSLLGNCTEMTCPPTKEACVFGQMQLENGTLIRNGSCVVSECREGVYTLTYGPHSSLWVSTDCCVNGCGRAARQEAGGTWNGGGPQILKGCATPNVCHLQVNTTLGPEASGFRLVSQPECNYVVTPTLPGPPANTSLTTDRVTVCVTCSGLNSCDTVPCPADRNYCLQTAGILEESVDFGFQINSTCCQGNCQALTPPEGVPASHPLSGFLCPTCPNGHPGPCNSSFYVQCPVGETECVQLDLLSIEGSQNVTLRGCGSQNLCGVSAATAKALLTFPGHRLAHQPHCSTTRRAILESECPSGAPPGLRLARSVLLVALGFLALS
ncbi:hypothetical protein PRBEI_2001578700 [Prionailurus iriomotensis]